VNGPLVHDESATKDVEDEAEVVLVDASEEFLLEEVVRVVLIVDFEDDLAVVEVLDVFFVEVDVTFFAARSWSTPRKGSLFRSMIAAGTDSKRSR